MKKLTSLIIGVFSFFTPIELCVILLIFMMVIDTLVKLVSLNRLAKKEAIDFYALTPFIDGSIKYFGLAIELPTQAICTNFLLIIFCLIELSSINENYFDITGNNILKTVWQMTKKIRDVIKYFTGFIKETKDDL